MRRHQALSVGQIIQAAMERVSSTDEYYRQQACYVWAEVVGPTVNAVTSRRYVDGTVMHVYIVSAVVKSELTFARDAIVRHINDLVGRQVVTQLVIH